MTGSRSSPGRGTGDPWNTGPSDLHARGIFEPDNDFVEAYASVYAHHLTEGGLNEQEELPFLQIVVIVRATGGQSFGGSPPVAIQKAALPLLAAIGRLRGYKPSYE